MERSAHPGASVRAASTPRISLRSIRATKASQCSSKQRTKTVDLVLDPVLPQRPPIDAGVDGEHRLVEPELGDTGKARHHQIGADLHDGVDVRAVDLVDGVAQLTFGDVRVLHRARAAQALEVHDVEAAILEKFPHLRVADGI